MAYKQNTTNNIYVVISIHFSHKPFIVAVIAEG